LNVNCNVEQHVATASTPDMDKPQMLKMYSSLYAVCISTAEFYQLVLK